MSVSIHARQFHSGRRGVSWTVYEECPFQSTPANFTAGDKRHTAFLEAQFSVSIHARQFHSGRLIGLDRG